MPKLENKERILKYAREKCQLSTKDLHRLDMWLKW
jgi:hypothetical protein